MPELFIDIVPKTHKNLKNLMEFYQNFQENPLNKPKNDWEYNLCYILSILPNKSCDLCFKHFTFEYRNIKRHVLKKHSSRDQMMVWPYLKFDSCPLGCHDEIKGND